MRPETSESVNVVVMRLPTKTKNIMSMTVAECSVVLNASANITE